MYYEIINTSPHSPIHSIWYADSSDEVDYAVAPELTANLVIKLYANESEVLLSGAVTKQKHYPYEPDTQYFGIRFHAGYVYPRQVASLHELKNCSVEIPDTLLKSWDCLDERLREKQSLQTQFAELMTIVPMIYDDSQELSNSLQEALYHIHQRCGVISIYELRQKLSISERQLQRLFKTQLGLSPKMTCNTIRIRHIVDTLWNASQKPNLAELALAYGYTDQAHFANDFRQVMGMSISEYLG